MAERLNTTYSPMCLKHKNYCLFKLYRAARKHRVTFNSECLPRIVSSFNTPSAGQFQGIWYCILPLFTTYIIHLHLSRATYSWSDTTVWCYIWINAWFMFSLFIMFKPAVFTRFLTLALKYLWIMNTRRPHTLNLLFCLMNLFNKLISEISY